MSLVIAMKDIKPDQRRPAKKAGGMHTHFFRASSDRPDAPNAFLVEHSPDCFHSAHYHEKDEFQIMVQGKGKVGRHELSAYCVHFARAYTPYGPLLSGKETGWGFMTLRTHYDRGAQRALDQLKQIPNRRPWQVTKHVTFPTQNAGIELQEIAGLKDEQGLFACTLSMAPRTRAAAPDPSFGDGQYVLVVNGSLLYEGREHTALAVVFIRPEEDAFQIHAGAQGLQGFILNFPQVKPRAVDIETPSSAAGYKKWQCTLCSFVYDEAVGMPEENIPAGTRWEDVPDTWSCPDCSTSKSDFEMVAL
jgi:rubredoxin